VSETDREEGEGEVCGGEESFFGERRSAMPVFVVRIDFLQLN
jgi:hypothetical protein